MKIRSLSLRAAGALAVLLLVPPALADINIGVTLSATGPAASLGIPEKNTIELLPTTLGGEKINWIVLDDASDEKFTVSLIYRTGTPPAKLRVFIDAILEELPGRLQISPRSPTLTTSAG